MKLVSDDSSEQEVWVWAVCGTRGDVVVEM